MSEFKNRLEQFKIKCKNECEKIIKKQKEEIKMSECLICNGTGLLREPKSSENMFTGGYSECECRKVIQKEESKMQKFENGDEVIVYGNVNVRYVCFDSGKHLIMDSAKCLNYVKDDSIRPFQPIGEDNSDAFNKMADDIILYRNQIAELKKELKENVNVHNSKYYKDEINLLKSQLEERDDLINRQELSMKEQYSEIERYKKECEERFDILVRVNQLTCEY